MTHYFKLIFFASFASILFSCDRGSEYYSVGLQSEYLQNSRLELESEVCLFRDSTGKILLATADPLGIYFYDFRQQAYVDSVTFPYTAEQPQAMAVTDQENFLVAYESKLICSLNGHVKQLSADVGDSLVHLLLDSPLEIFPSLGKMVLQVANYHHNPTARYKGDKPLLIALDTSGHFEFLHIHRPEIYAGPTKVSESLYLSREGEHLIMSYNIDESIYIYDMRTHTYSSKIIKAKESNTAQIEGDTTNKEKRLEKKLENDLLMESYGRALVDRKKSKTYRFFRPRMPERAADGRYYTRRDHGLHIVVHDSLGENKEYILPNGRYFMPQRWWCFNDTMYHLKYQKDAKEKSTFYLDMVTFYNY